jgi:hypothetical protein
VKVRTALLAMVALLLPLAAACSDDSGDDEETTTTTEAEATDSTEAEGTDTTEAEGTDTTEAEGTDTTEAQAAPVDPEISAALAAAFNVPQDVADCATAALEGTVSDEAWEAIRSANRANLPPAEITQVENALKAAFASCE